jgi:predicted transcriptional regulator
MSTPPRPSSSAAASGPLLSSLTRINSTVKDLVIYIYDLSALDSALLFLLIKHNEPMTLEQLSTTFDRDKSNIFRSLQKLVGLGICIKETKTIKQGGYFHLYSAIDVKSLKTETEKKVKELEKGCRRLLRKFEGDMQRVLAATAIISYIFVTANT